MTRVAAALALLATAAPTRAQHVHIHADGQRHVHEAPVAGAVVTSAAPGLRLDAVNPPLGSAVGRAGATLADGTYLSVVYGQPFVRGRTVFGGLVGWGAVWATGAHTSTELAVTRPILFGGTRVEPGLYSLFSTPRPDRWTFHLNRALGMHLADDYDEALNVAEADATPEALGETVQALTLDFVPAGAVAGTAAGAAAGVDLRLQWDRTAVRVPIRPAP